MTALTPTSQALADVRKYQRKRRGTYAEVFSDLAEVTAIIRGNMQQGRHDLARQRLEKMESTLRKMSEEA